MCDSPPGDKALAIAALALAFAVFIVLPLVALAGAAGPSVALVVGFLGLIILTDTCWN